MVALATVQSHSRSQNHTDDDDDDNDDNNARLTQVQKRDGINPHAWLRWWSEDSTEFGVEISTRHPRAEPSFARGRFTQEQSEGRRRHGGAQAAAAVRGPN